MPSLPERDGRFRVMRSCVFGALFAPLCHMLANVDDWHGLPFAVVAVAASLGALVCSRFVARRGRLDRASVFAIVLSAALATALLAGLDSITIGHALGALLAWAIACSFAAGSLAVALATGVRYIVRAIVACILALATRHGNVASLPTARRDPDLPNAVVAHLRSRGFRAPPHGLRPSLT